MPIQVTVIEGRNLKNNDLFDKIDPIFKIFTGRGITSSEKTSSRHNETNPVYNETFTLKYDDHHQELHVELLDREMFGMDTDKVGSCIVSLMEVAQRGWIEGWWVLTSKKGKSVGEVHLRICMC
ncbi:hypothetical protein K493DRAFT_319030 [Basidiobolus meristosporus CBS 931.73]|uniref:C2 domain-containing protein n=1 Tax=Basidiobolus meristosporus CBS 931.73 TaxID=1314790 RepID=A0A1Y1XTE6_9FUNG|nr:hypothetical protein K493DRAFT_319030 [Basidiobolus meristosporus CBS 931.73]|eukprot:ORX89022.1 hypothetical protein K493DRAFT_319030 [Basidiobolus meristosporus CBS 931.73]